MVGNKTNHSLRATSLFDTGVPEKVIQDRTGHRSLEGLCKYKKISERQKEEACKVLSRRNPRDTMETQTNSVSNWSMQVAAPMYSSQQQQLTPTCSFGSATLNGCTINVFQAPQTARDELPSENC